MDEAMCMVFEQVFPVPQLALNCKTMYKTSQMAVA